MINGEDLFFLTRILPSKGMIVKMINFIINGIIWTLAIYGFMEIMKIVCGFDTYNIKESDGIYLAVAVKNQESTIENFLRSLIFKILYGKEKQIKEIRVIDLNSNDGTMQILKKMEEDSELVKVIDGKEFLEWAKSFNKN